MAEDSRNKHSLTLELSSVTPSFGPADRKCAEAVNQSWQTHESLVKGSQYKPSSCQLARPDLRWKKQHKTPQHRKKDVTCEGSAKRTFDVYGTVLVNISHPSTPGSTAHSKDTYLVSHWCIRDRWWCSRLCGAWTPSTKVFLHQGLHVLRVKVPCKTARPVSTAALPSPSCRTRRSLHLPSQICNKPAPQDPGSGQEQCKPRYPLYIQNER